MYKVAVGEVKIQGCIKRGLSEAFDISAPCRQKRQFAFGHQGDICGGYIHRHISVVVKSESGYCSATLSKCLRKVIHGLLVVTAEKYLCVAVVHYYFADLGIITLCKLFIGLDSHMQPYPSAS